MTVVQFFDEEDLPLNEGRVIAVTPSYDGDCSEQEHTLATEDYEATTEFIAA